MPELDILRLEQEGGETVVRINAQKLRSTSVDTLLAYRPEDAIRKAAAAQAAASQVRAAGGERRGR
jgi:hypothetical protein